MMRYIRAFWTALKMTLRGERLSRPYEPLWQWVEEGGKLAKSALQTADANGMPQPVRQQGRLKIEGRDMSMDVILSTVAYHMEQEYPHLLVSGSAHTLTAIYASNMNDQYYVRRLGDSNLIDNPDIQRAVKSLDDHLHAIPPSTEIDAGPRTGSL